MASPLIARAALRQTHPARIRRAATSQWARHSSSSHDEAPRSRPRIGGLLAVFALSGGAVWAYPLVSSKLFPQAEQVPVETVIEKPKTRKTPKTPTSKELNRDLVSSEHPGVYAWGSNAGKVVAPDLDEAVVKAPRRISFFDGQILRDLKLDRDFGAAVTENGDLVQWGAAFSQSDGDSKPVVTLKGKDIAKIALSRDRIIALASNGSVYSLPVSASDQARMMSSRQAPDQQKGSLSWIPFWSSAPSSSAGNYRTLQPKDLKWGEKIVDVRSGLDHCLFLTSKGRVFSAAASSMDFPEKGQLGIPDLTWDHRPEGPYDQPHEVKGLGDCNIKAIAAGNFHSLTLDDQGNLYSFGENSRGQLGFQFNPEKPYVDQPLQVPVHKLYAGTNLVPKVTSIAAGGVNSYFTVDATQAPNLGYTKALVPANNKNTVVADTWACGGGIFGSLGNGKWTHISNQPTKINTLSSLSEFDEATNSATPIRLAGISVGSTHACAVMDNKTTEGGWMSWLRSPFSGSDSSFGADAMMWGGNESYQLGTGKRINANMPVYVPPLDGGRGGTELKTKGSQRLQIMPKRTVRLGDGRKATVEQRIECGRHATAVYCAPA
ncbi:regulator of chromosome condensation 1/beta-lactamase-inhibitor protein II [Apodospora peruviana]|uniref:Regulator of chromosome condensation 1/beta-lactamase-inhibitor protein II n=1 Tax=Apodospora peruviana TaxID=516989 RepID=A0AAE0M7M0_9PEZI|nr:regulator of chromosome condensation 1/beta-lactamase-inhibitor protein II [Apodospora peruviana]